MSRKSGGDEKKVIRLLAWNRTETRKNEAEKDKDKPGQRRRTTGPGKAPKA
ncbi:MAG: hypothetical protein QM289_05245 [Bacillota bacterium]|jgi:hypothetical protein|nr:hypothetical protein [Bacillota bacterium]